MKTSPCSPRAPNLLHVLPSRMVGWNEFCSPEGYIPKKRNSEEKQHICKLFTFIFSLNLALSSQMKCWTNFYIRAQLWFQLLYKEVSSFSKRSSVQLNLTCTDKQAQKSFLIDALRLEICHKFYTTRFFRQTILHTKKAEIATIFATDKSAYVSM